MSHIEKCRNLCHATLKIPEGLRGEPDAIQAEALRWREALLELERAGDEGNAVKLELLTGQLHGRRAKQIAPTRQAAEPGAGLK